VGRYVLEILTILVEILALFSGSPLAQQQQKVRRGRAWYPFADDARHIDVTVIMN